MEMNQTRLMKTFVTMGEKILPGERRWVKVNPQFLFKPRTLAYAGPDDNFKLHAIVVGNNDQGQFRKNSRSDEDGIPMETFRCPIDVVKFEEAMSKAEISPEALNKIGDFLNNLGKIDTLQVAMDFKLLVSNIRSRPNYLPGGRQDDFTCIVYGDTIT